MYHSKKGSVALMGIISFAMLSMLFCLVGTAPALAASEAEITQHETASPSNSEPAPTVDYSIYLTNPWYYDEHGNPLVGGVFQANAQSDETGRAGGQASLQLLTSLQLVFAQVDEILVDANQNPVGAVLSGQGEKSVNGRTERFNFIFIVRYAANGACCQVRILSPAIHESGGVRLDGPGTLSFTRR